MEGPSATNHFNNFCIEVNQRGSQLLETGQWSDCNFLVGAEAESDRVVIACHKLILSMASPVFEAMFYGDMAEKNDPIPIIDVRPATFMALLQYIYTGHLNITSIEIAYELCYTAKKYMLMEHVERECLKYIWKRINPTNVCQVYEYALLFEADTLIQKCIQVISMCTREVLQDSSFLDIQLSTAMAIFSLDFLDIDNELDLAAACVRYAKALDKKNSETSSQASENEEPNKAKSPEPSISKPVVEKTINDSDSDTLNETLYDEFEESLRGPPDLISDPIDTVPVRGLLEKIRFLTLTIAQLELCTAILTDDERAAIDVNIVALKCHVPMPPGLSTNRVRRHLMVDLGDDNDEARAYANFRYRIECLHFLREDVWSPTCYVRNLTWKLKVIPSLSPSQNNHRKRGLILHCSSEDGSTDWSCDARIVVATVHQTGFPAGFKYYVHSFRSDSNILAIPVEWDVLLNPHNEYVTDDAITFEVRMITDTPYDMESHRKKYSSYTPRGD